MEMKKCDVIKNGVKLFAVCVLLLGITSCSKDNDDDNVVVYSIGISSWESSSLLSDLKKVDDYLLSKGCKNGDVKMYHGDNEKADAQAKAEFETQVSKLKREEVAALGLQSGTKFTYSVSRMKDPHNPQSEVIIVASWKYPQ